jgi:DNA-directed RNA polymerase specialized sigma24 family protein
VTVTTDGVRRTLWFDELVASSERRLLRLGLMLTGGMHSAEDLVQTVSARASS